MYTYIFPFSPLFRFSKSTAVPPYRLYRQLTLISGFADDKIHLENEK
jgi:hypothetical protein